jgi:hypothetical protein
MRSFLLVSAGVLLYSVALMGATGTAPWDAAVTDREAAELFGGACSPWMNRDCPGTGAKGCRAYGGYYPGTASATFSGRPPTEYVSIGPCGVWACGTVYDYEACVATAPKE